MFAVIFVRQLRLVTVCMSHTCSGHWQTAT